MDRSGKESGWAWFVCLGTFTTFLLVLGTEKSFGVLLPALQEDFATHTWVIGLVVSLGPGFGAISCILGGIFTKFLPPRVVMMAFGLVSSVGLIIAVLSGSIFLFSFAVLLTGFSIGAEAITVAALPLYFNTFYDLANGIAHSGVSIGLMIIPPLTQFLLDTYGWRGTLLILGGLNSHLIACGAVLRPLKLAKIKGENETASASKSNSSKLNKNLTTSLLQLMDIDLFFNSGFLCLLCLSTAGGYHHTSWIIYFVPHCEEFGFLPYESAFLATVGGVGNLAGTGVFPVATKYLSGKPILYISVLTTTLALAIDPFMSLLHSYVGMMASSFLYNVGDGVTFCFIYMDLVLQVEGGKLSNAVGWLFVGYSLGSILSGFMSGWLYDNFGTYITSFLSLSIVSAISVTPWLVEDFKTAVTKQAEGHDHDYSILKNVDAERNEH